MKIIKFNENLEEIIEEAIKVLENDGLVIYPTETAYGVGVNALSESAVRKLLNYKNRPEGKPISVGVTTKEMAEELVEISEHAEKIYDTLLPGPVTVVSKSKGRVVNLLESEDGKLGIRIPDHEVPLGIIDKAGFPITTTSANYSGKKTPYSIDDIFENLTQKSKDLIDLVIDFGKLPKKPTSTVVDTTLNDLNIIRSGTIEFSHNMREYTSGNVEETFKIASSHIKSNEQVLREKGIVYLLDGDLGAGKTHFTKGLGQFFNIEDIDSPTYTVMNEYNTTTGRFLHIDTWRLESSVDLNYLRIEDYLKPGNIIVVEWWSKFKEYFDELLQERETKIFKVFIKKKENKRIIVIDE